MSSSYFSKVDELRDNGKILPEDLLVKLYVPELMAHVLEYFTDFSHGTLLVLSRAFELPCDRK